MKITPINNNNLQNHLKFRGKKNQSLPKMNKPAKMALIPALAFAAMVPSLVNAKTGDVKQDEPVVQVQTITKNANMPYYLQPEYVLYEKDFKMDGEKYTMMYADYGKRFTERDGAVSDIFFVPESYKLIRSGSEELNRPPKLEQLIKHNDENGNYFVGALVSEMKCDKDGENFKYITKEIVLPEEVGNELLDLYEGRTNFYLMLLKNTYTDTYSTELKETTVQNGKKVVSQ